MCFLSFAKSRIIITIKDDLKVAKGQLGKVKGDWEEQGERRGRGREGGYDQSSIYSCMGMPQ